MKKAIVLVLFVGLIITTTSCDKGKQLNAINNFAKTYFPDTEVLAPIKDGFDYKVTLSDYTQIEFDGNLFGKFEWDEVDCKHSTNYTAVPETLIPYEIKDYVSRLHQSQNIVKIAKDNRGWEIELSNGIEIEFDKRFNIVDFDD